MLQRVLTRSQHVARHHIISTCHPTIITSRHNSRQTEFSKFVFKVMGLIPNHPLTTIRNIYSNLYVNYVLGQHFSLKEFLETCPQAVKTVAQILLDKNEHERLEAVMDERCREKVLATWNDLQPAQQRDQADMDLDICRLLSPQVDLKEKVVEGVTKHFLFVRVQMYQSMDLRFWKEHLDVENPMIRSYMNPDKGDVSSQEAYKLSQTLSQSISMNGVVMKRDVSKGVEGNWKFVFMDRWPKPNSFNKRVQNYNSKK